MKITTVNGQVVITSENYVITINDDDSIILDTAKPITFVGRAMRKFAKPYINSSVVNPVLRILSENDEGS